MAANSFFRSAMGVSVCALMATGCLIKDEHHTLFLDPATGEVTWMVSEHDVYSDEVEAAKRLGEETEYWQRVQGGTHGSARFLRAIGASEVRTVMIRGVAPFSLVTDANVPAIDELGRRLLGSSGAVGSSVLQREGDSVVWTMKARGVEHDSDQDADDPLGLIEPDTLRVVLTSGRFESAVGFNLDDGRRVATLDADYFADADDNAEVVLSLRWTTQAPAALQPDVPKP